MSNNIKAFILDLDGTVYFGDKLAPGAKKLIAKLKEKDIKVFFMTNNSNKSRKEIFLKLISLGIDLDLNQVYSSAYLAIKFIKDNNFTDVYTVGSNSLKHELINNGINITDNEEDATTVLIGFDTNFNFETLSKALRASLNSNNIIACNKDKKFPGKDNKIFPGCGAMVSMIEACSDKKVDYIVGKPNTLMLELLISENNLKKEEVIVVGDNFDSDIIMAQNFGCESYLVSNNEIENINCIKGIAELIDII